MAGYGNGELLAVQPETWAGTICEMFEIGATNASVALYVKSGLNKEHRASAPSGVNGWSDFDTGSLVYFSVQYYCPEYLPALES
ncbi:hypothetical protein BH683_017625 [Williamsia sp. 1138]|nr:hypothetical protein BH683_017625 [Williamsia sp. 1138]